MRDPFDLAAWPIEEEPQRIYGDAALSIWALVDSIDYAWASRHTWSVLRRPGKRVYLRRNVEPGTFRLAGSGVVVRSTQHTEWLHIEIMKRTGEPPPSPEHVLVDHRDHLDTLNNCRHNLQWATYSMNNRNR